MTAPTAAPNCIDIAGPFRDELAARPDLPDVQIMGGIGSIALQHPRTVILLDERRIVAPADFLTDTETAAGQATQRGLARFREDGTLRDFDLPWPKGRWAMRSTYLPSASMDRKTLKSR
jgi:hypothetical protein